MQFGEPFGGLLPGARGAVLAALLRTGAPLTGRQIHGLLADRYSLWSVQEALKALEALGVIRTEAVGRAGVHSINEEHVAVTHLRGIVDPIDSLTIAIQGAIDSRVQAVLLFGSIARGDALPHSDVDLACLVTEQWDGKVALEDAVWNQLGNRCDVLTFSVDEFMQLARRGEPVVAEILRDGVALIGDKPRVASGARR